MLKSIYCLALEWVSLPISNFLTSCISYLENIVPLICSPELWHTLFCTIKTATFVSSHQSHRSVLEVLKSYQTPGGAYKCSTFLTFFSWKLKFYHWQQIPSPGLLKMTSSLHPLLRLYLPSTQGRITIVCQPFYISCKKVVVGFATQTLTCLSAFPQDNSGTGVGSRNTLGELPVLPHRKFKMYMYRRRKLQCNQLLLPPYREF